MLPMVPSPTDTSCAPTKQHFNINPIVDTHYASFMRIYMFYISHAAYSVDYYSTKSLACILSSLYK